MSRRLREADHPLIIIILVQVTVLRAVLVLRYVSDVAVDRRLGSKLASSVATRFFRLPPFSSKVWRVSRPKMSEQGVSWSRLGGGGLKGS